MRRDGPRPHVLRSPRVARGEQGPVGSAAAMRRSVATPRHRLRERAHGGAPAGDPFPVVPGRGRAPWRGPRPFHRRRAGPGADGEVLDRLGLPPALPVHLGTLEPRKDRDLVAAFDRLAGGHPLELVLAGGAGWKAGPVAVVAGPRSGLGFAGSATSPRRTSRRCCAAPALVDYPSCEEGFGLPALEALACGAPLVTTSGRPWPRSPAERPARRAGRRRGAGVAMEAEISGDAAELGRRQADGISSSRLRLGRLAAARLPCTAHVRDLSLGRLAAAFAGRAASIGRSRR